MKKQNTLEEKKTRKAALKMTVVFMSLVVVIEAVIFVIISFGAKYIAGLAFDKMPVFIGIACFDIVLAIAGYFDFKRKVVEWQKNDKDNEITE